MKTASALAICLLAFGAVATNSQTLTSPAAGRNAMPGPRTVPLAGTGAATRIVTTIAGLTRTAYGNGGAATAAYLGNPRGVTVDAAGNFYISDSDNNQIRKVNPATGVISAIAGTGQCGLTGDGQLGLNVQICNPLKATFDSMGNLYFADAVEVREVNALTGIITTVAGNGRYGYSGDGGAATQAALADPTAVAVDSA